MKHVRQKILKVKQKMQNIHIIIQVIVLLLIIIIKIIIIDVFIITLVFSWLINLGMEEEHIY